MTCWNLSEISRKIPEDLSSRNLWADLLRFAFPSLQRVARAWLSATAPRQHHDISRPTPVRRSHHKMMVWICWSLPQTCPYYYLLILGIVSLTFKITPRYLKVMCFMQIVVCEKLKFASCVLYQSLYNSKLLTMIYEYILYAMLRYIPCFFCDLFIFFAEKCHICWWWMAFLWLITV